LQWLVGVYGMYSIKEQLLYEYDEETYQDINKPINNYAMYLQALYKASDKLTFNAGVRYDYYDTFGSHISPRLSAVYSLSEKSALKFIYGEAFRAPNGYELYYDDDDTQKGNSNLVEEKIESYEVVWEHHFSKDHSLTLNGFYYKMDDLLRLTTDPSDDLLVYENLDMAESKGVEIEYKKSWENGVQTAYNYTYQYATDTHSNEWLVNSPKHLANARISFPFLEKYRTSLSVQYVGEKKTINDESVNDYLISNLSVRGDNIIEGLDISATVYNLFDTAYAHVAGEEHVQESIGQNGLAFRVNTVYKF